MPRPPNTIRFLAIGVVVSTFLPFQGDVFGAAPEEGHQAIRISGSAHFAAYSRSGQEFVSEQVDFTCLLWNDSWEITVVWENGGAVTTRGLPVGSLSLIHDPAVPDVRGLSQLTECYPDAGASRYTRLLWLAFCLQSAPEECVSWERLPSPEYDALHSPRAYWFETTPFFDPDGRLSRIIYTPVAALDRDKIDVSVATYISWETLERSFAGFTNSVSGAVISFAEPQQRGRRFIPRSIVFEERFRSTNNLPAVSKRLVAQVTDVEAVMLPASLPAVHDVKLSVTDLRVRLPHSNINWLTYTASTVDELRQTNDSEFLALLQRRLASIGPDFQGRPLYDAPPGPTVSRWFLYGALLLLLIHLGVGAAIFNKRNNQLRKGNLHES